MNRRIDRLGADRGIHESIDWRLVVMSSLCSQGAIETTLVLTSSSRDPAYDNILDRPVTVTLIDNDGSGVDLGFDPALGLMVVEGGSTRVLDVTLTSEPLSPVTLLISSQGGQLAINPPQLVFTKSDYRKVRRRINNYLIPRSAICGSSADKIS